MAYGNMISRSDIAARQKESVMAKGLGKVQSSPKIKSGNGTPSPKGMGNPRPSFQNLK
jgi:hypothetical protein